MPVQTPPHGCLFRSYGCACLLVLLLLFLMLKGACPPPGEQKTVEVRDPHKGRGQHTQAAHQACADALCSRVLYPASAPPLPSPPCRRTGQPAPQPLAQSSAVTGQRRAFWLGASEKGRRGSCTLSTARARPESARIDVPTDDVPAVRGAFPCAVNDFE